MPSKITLIDHTNTISEETPEGSETVTKERIRITTTWVHLTIFLVLLVTGFAGMWEGIGDLTAAEQTEMSILINVLLIACSFGTMLFGIALLRFFGLSTEVIITKTTRTTRTMRTTCP
jgi:hypothetical protein